MLLALCLALFLPGLRGMPVFELGEAATALAARHALDAGGEVEGIALVQLLTVRLLEWLGLVHRSGIAAYRLPALAGALLAVLAIHHWGRALVGRRAALLGAAMLAASAGLVAVAHLAIGAAPALACVIMATGLLGWAYLRPRPFGPVQGGTFWAAAALAAWLGGPGAGAVPLITAAMLAVTDRDAGWFRALRPGLGMPGAVALLLLLPGGVADPGLGHWPGAALLGFPALAFPSAWAVLAALPFAWRARRRRRVRFLLAWATAGALAAEMLGGLAHLALPAPMLLGALWACGAGRRAGWGWGRAAVLVAGALAVTAPVLAAVAIDLRQLPFGLMAVAAALLLTWRVPPTVRRGARVRALMLGLLLALPVYLALLEGAFSRLLIARAGPRIAGTIGHAAPGLPPERIGIAGLPAATLAFALGSGLHPLRDGAEAARFLAGAPGRLVAVGEAEERALQAEADRLGLRPRLQAQVVLFEWSRLRFLVALVYLPDTPAGDAQMMPSGVMAPMTRPITTRSPPT